MNFLAQFDAFSTASDDYRVKTNTGAIVSILAVVLMVFLFISEMSFNFKTELHDHLFVNTSSAAHLKIDFDLSFPEIPCNLISIDVLDDLGAPQLNSVHTIYKNKLSKEGQALGEPEKHESLGNTITSENQLENLVNLHRQSIGKTMKSRPDCGECYGAGEPGQCCNTCDEVKAAYDHMGWRFKPQGVAQCESELFVRNLKDQFAEDGGCRVYGQLEPEKPFGHFHIAPHKKLHRGGENSQVFNLMELISFAFDQFNISHSVNTLSFGDQYPGFTSPLDGQSRSLQDTHGMYQYYVKVVPTKYQYLNGTTVESNQYSVTEHLRHLSPGSGRGFPGVYFYFEVSPIQALFQERKPSIYHFFTSICAIIGGAYTVMGIFDYFMTMSLSLWKSKKDLLFNSN